MAVPKRKSSKRVIRTRRHAHRVQVTTGQACPQCGAPQRSHRVCGSCGYYKGRQVVSGKSE